MCFDAKNGTRLWETSFGVYGSGGLIIVRNGTVYVCSPDYNIGGVVKTIDANTGNLLPLQFQAKDTSFSHKSGPTAFTVVDDRVFVDQSRWRAYNAISGDLLWESTFNTYLPELPDLESVWAFEDNLVIVSGGTSSYTIGNIYSKRVYRINPDTGTVLWSTRGFSNEQPLVYDDMIIFWNYKENYADIGQKMIAMEASSGATLWSINLKAESYQPIIYNDQLLFVTSNGFLYALDLPDGSLAWNTRVTLPYAPTVSPIEVDAQMQRIFWSYTTGQYNESIDDFQYEGNIYSLDLSNGELIWATPFSNNGRSGTKIVLLNNTVYLSAGNDLWAFNKLTGMKLGVETFDHYLQPIASADDKLFVAADLYVMAYADFGSTITDPSSGPSQLINMLSYTTLIFVIFLLIAILLLFLYRRKKRKGLHSALAIK